MINQLFDIASIRQNAQEVTTEIEKIKSNLQTLSVKVKIEVPSDIQTQINSLNATFGSVNQSLGEITAAQLRYAKALTETAKQAKLQAQTQATLNKAKGQTIVTAQQAAEVYGVEAKSIAEAAEQNKILRAYVKQLDLTQAENVVTLQKYNQQIEKNTEFIRKNSDAHVQQKMNIGNYNSVWKGLNTSVQQLVREMPSAKYRLDVFFLAISNNIPMLMDAIKGMQAYNKQMVETGQLDKKVSIGKELLKSLVSWQTAIMIGVTLLVQYGDEIINWVGNLIKGRIALDSAAIAQEHLNTSIKEGVKNAQSELTELRVLTRAVSDNTLSMEDRRKALNKLKNEYPEHLKNLTDEEILAGKVGDAYNRIAEEIIATSVAQAQMKEATKMAENLVEIQAKSDFLKNISSVGDAEAQKEAIRSRINELYSGEYRKVIGLEFLSDDAGKEIQTLEKYLKAYETFLNFIDKSSYVKSLKEDETSNRLFAEGTVGWYQEQIKALEDEIQSSNDRGVIKALQNKIQGYNDEIARLLGEESKKTKDVKSYADTLLDLITKYGAEPIEGQRERAKEAVRLRFEDEVKAIKNIGEDATEEEIRAYEALVAWKENEFAKIDEKFDGQLAREAKKLAKTYNDYLRTGLNAIDNQYDQESSSSATSLLREQTILTEKYNANKINEEQYQREMLELKQKYAEQSLELEIEYAQKELDALQEARTTALDAGVAEELLDTNMSEENINRLISLVDKLKAELANLKAENGKAKNGMSLAGILGIDDEAIEVAEATMQGIQDIMGEIDNLVNASFDARLQRIEEEAEAVEESHERQLESLQNLYEQGAISQEEYEARKRLQEELTEKKKEQLAKKEAELKEKQAKYEKASAIAQALINTALAITNAATVQPFIPLGAIAMGIASTMGALQVATILATPIPKYAKGTSHHKGGLAIVGDGGKQEVVMTNDGAYLTPDTPTLINLPRGARVLPDADLLTADDLHWARKPFLGGLQYDENGMPIIINDYSSLEREQRMTRKQLEKYHREMVKMQRQASVLNYKSRVV